MILRISGSPFRKWDYVTANADAKTRRLIVEVNRSGDGTYYTVAELSRWWVIRKIQLWAIKKAFR